MVKKVLIVDDEDLILYSLSRALRKEKRQVNTVATGRDALRQIGHQCYDLCILDIGLPDMTGVEVMQAAKIIAPATTIIMMTADEVNDDMRKTIQEQACLFFTKPFELSQVRSLVNTVLHDEEHSAVYSSPNFFT